MRNNNLNLKSNITKTIIITLAIILEIAIIGLAVVGIVSINKNFNLVNLYEDNIVDSLLVGKYYYTGNAPTEYTRSEQYIEIIDDKTLRFSGFDSTAYSYENQMILQGPEIEFDENTAGAEDENAFHNQVLYYYLSEDEPIIYLSPEPIDSNTNLKLLRVLLYDNEYEIYHPYTYLMYKHPVI